MKMDEPNDELDYIPHWEPTLMDLALDGVRMIVKGLTLLAAVYAVAYAFTKGATDALR